MPHRSTAILRAFSRVRMSDSAARVTLGSVPRIASLAPSSRMTAAVPSGIDQSSRSRPPEVVSPDTPALTMSTFIPLDSNAFCRRAGKAWSAGRPSPAVSESPKATILIGLAGAAAGACARACPVIRNARINTMMCAKFARAPSTPRAELPYDAPMDSRIETSSLTGIEPDTISISNVNLSLGSGAARVHILKDISLRVGSGEAIGLIGPSGSGKSTLLMVMAGLERPDSGEVVVNGTPFNALDEDALARFRARQVGI